MYLPGVVSYASFYFIVNFRVKHLGKTFRTAGHAATSTNRWFVHITLSEEPSLTDWS